ELRSAVRKRRRQAAADAAEEVGWLSAEVDGMAARIAAHAPARFDPGAADPPPEAAALRPGVQVRVLPLRARGEVAAPPQDGRVTVQVGALRTTVAVADVRVLSGRERRHAARAAAALARARAEEEARARRGGRTDGGLEMLEAPTEGRALARTPDATLDLRGERVHDAISALDRFLDESLRAEREVVFVIHGHGTGALRSAVRQHVRGHAAVREFRPGDRGEGGDGV